LEQGKWRRENGEGKQEDEDRVMVKIGKGSVRSFK
jgi:hypothetical protein